MQKSIKLRKNEIERSIQQWLPSSKTGKRNLEQLVNLTYQNHAEGMTGTWSVTTAKRKAIASDVAGVPGEAVRGTNPQI